METRSVTSASTRISLTTEAPLWRTMLAFLLPLMGSNILQSLSSTVSAVFVGQMLGVSALAAVSTVFPLFFFLISFLIGFSGASAVLIGQAYGARDIAQAKAVAGTTLSVSLLFGLTIAIVCGVFTESLLHAIGTPSDALPEA